MRDTLTQTNSKNPPIFGNASRPFDLKPNISTTDRLVRLGIETLLFVLYFGNILIGTIGIVALLIASVAIITATINFCPFYKLLGINTNKNDY